MVSTTYAYEVVATRVVKLNANWPNKGMDVRGGPYTFWPRASPSSSFGGTTSSGVPSHGN